MSDWADDMVGEMENSLFFGDFHSNEIAEALRKVKKEKDDFFRGSPPEPVSHPNQEWCDNYAKWYYGKV